MKKIVLLVLFTFVSGTITPFAAISEYEHCGYKVTSPRVASTAGKLLRSKRSTPSVRSVAGSALSQRQRRK